MRAAQVSAFGSPDDVITVADDVPRPVLKTKGTVLLKVHAVSLSPSDYRMTSGSTSLFKPPKHTVWPYIPGGDICGTVVEVLPDEEKFKVGDVVIATWDEYGMGGIAGYAIVETKLTESKPANVSFVEGAALADSSVNAMLALEDVRFQKGERLLVLGGSGAVATSLIQLAKDRGAAYIAATSSDEKLVKSLGADVVINYREQNWWEAPEIKAEPFDVVIDCAEGATAFKKVVDDRLCKSAMQGGRYLAFVWQEWDMDVTSWWQMIKWCLPVLRRVAYTRVNRSRPRYSIMTPGPRGGNSANVARLLKIVADGRLKVVIDPASPHEFTTEGVRAAFNLMVARGGHGKVVISVSNE